MGCQSPCLPEVSSHSLAHSLGTQYISTDIVNIVNMCPDCRIFWKDLHELLRAKKDRESSWQTFRMDVVDVIRTLDSKIQEAAAKAMVIPAHMLRKLDRAVQECILEDLTTRNVVDVIRAARPLSENRNFGLWNKLCVAVRNDPKLLDVAMKSL